MVPIQRGTVAARGNQCNGWPLFLDFFLGGGVDILAQERKIIPV